MDLSLGGPESPLNAQYVSIFWLPAVSILAGGIGVVGSVHYRHWHFKGAQNYLHLSPIVGYE